MVLVLLLGAQEAIAGIITVGTVVVLISYVKDFFTPIEQLADVFNILQSALAAPKPMRDVTVTPPTIYGTGLTQPLKLA